MERAELQHFFVDMAQLYCLQLTKSIAACPRLQRWKKMTESTFLHLLGNVFLVIPATPGCSGLASGHQVSLQLPLLQGPVLCGQLGLGGVRRCSVFFVSLEQANSRSAS